MDYRLILLLLLLVSQFTTAGNYILTIDGKPYELSLGQEEKIKHGEKDLVVSVSQKEILTYKTESFSFDHPNKFSPSKSYLGNGISQTVMMTPTGTVMLLQEYSNMNPTNLIDLMMQEVTKEEREYGYSIKDKPKTITLSNGVKLTGKEIISSYKGSNRKRYVLAHGVKDSGVLVMTQIDYDAAPNEEVLIDQFLKSLVVTIK